jgi:hypothetical protein
MFDTWLARLLIFVCGDEFLQPIDYLRDLIGDLFRIQTGSDVYGNGRRVVDQPDSLPITEALIPWRL